MLKGAWKSGTGGVFVRNPHWDAAQDPIRKAYPDQVAFTEGLDTQQVVQRLVADRGDDAAAVTRTSVPPAAVESALAAPGVRSRSNQPALAPGGVPRPQPEEPVDGQLQGPAGPGHVDRPHGLRAGHGRHPDGRPHHRR